MSEDKKRITDLRNKSEGLKDNDVFAIEDTLTTCNISAAQINTYISTKNNLQNMLDNDMALLTPEGAEKLKKTAETALKANVSFSNVSESDARKLIGNRLWVSAEFVPAKGVMTAATHNLNLSPEQRKRVFADVLLICKVAEAGYEPGDTVIWNNASGTYNNSNGTSPVLMQNTIGFTTGTGDSGLQIIHKTNGGSVRATLSNFRYVFRILY